MIHRSEGTPNETCIMSPESPESEVDGATPFVVAGKENKMDVEYFDVSVVGKAPFDEKLVDKFIDFIENTALPSTHYIGDSSTDDNPTYNKYIIHDAIFSRFFQSHQEYTYFLNEVLHTAMLPDPGTTDHQHMIHSLVGTIHAVLSAHLKKFFLMRVSVSVTEPEGFMHYHVDMGGAHADRFLIDITRPENNAFGIEVEDRLYALDRFTVYKLDTTRMHRAVNYDKKLKKISFIVQAISGLRQFIEYQREYMKAYSNVLAMNFPMSPDRVNPIHR